MTSYGQGSLRIVALLPAGPEASLYDFAPALRASEEAAFRREEGGRATTMADAVVVVDEEARVAPMEVLELLTSGPRVSLTIPCACELPLLALHLKGLGRHCSIELEVEDAAGALRRVSASNRQASVRVEAGASVAMPLDLAPGWNHLRIDVPDVLQRAFGVAYGRTVSVAVLASCRVARIWFENRAFEDVELPPFLRTL
jgi:hypothetical protein